MKHIAFQSAYYVFFLTYKPLLLHWWNTQISTMLAIWNPAQKPLPAQHTVQYFTTLTNTVRYAKL